MAALEKNVMVRKENAPPFQIVGFSLRYVSPMLEHVVFSLGGQWWEEVGGGLLKVKSSVCRLRSV